jgi:acetyl-CoA synthetase
MEPVNALVRRLTEDAREDPDAFWDRTARELPWHRLWDRVYEQRGRSFRWFAGAETNLSFSCLDHQVAEGRGGHAALVYLNERGERRTFTYAALRHEVTRLAAALRGMGVERGDRLTIYMPICPEAISLMLATVRVGAIHSVVFAGFGSGALGDRIRASGSKLVFAADVSYRKGKDVPLAGIVTEALASGCPSVEACVWLERAPGTGAREGARGATPRSIGWDEFLAGAEGRDGSHIWVEANDPAYILATSGTTASPKLAVHVHGGYAVAIHAMARWCFGLRPDDVWWATSDIGWVVGHSYIVYAPMLMGCTTLAYEGALDYPDPGIVWRIVEEQAVTGIFASPTGVRLLMRYGEEHPHAYDLSSLERVFCAGEVLNPPALEWLQRRALRDRVPVLDHWWQTETGGPMVGNPYGVAMIPTKPGSAGIPLPGVELAVVDHDGSELPAGEKGILVVRRPTPGLIPTLWGEPERYDQDYWEKVPGSYYTGDAVHIDEDGYVWFGGRADEIINIAAHRIGTIEVETALLAHPGVVEAGVTSKPDELRGEVIAAFVVLREGTPEADETRKELLATVRRELGPMIVISDVNFVGTLPKTRSGKIMRRVLKAVVLDRDPGDITTIEDAGSADEAREAWRAMTGRA